VQFITLQSPDNGLLTIVNIYTPRTSDERALLWRRISQAKFSSDHVILGGDFNHFEVTDHKGAYGTRQMHRREAASWHHMTLQYALADAWCLDSFHKMLEKEFTFDNGRVGKTSAISRIDKFMISQTVDEKGGRIEAAASMRKFTDHSPLIIKIWGRHDAPKNTSSFFDISLLRDERRKKEMLEAWAGDAPLPTNDQDWPPWLEAATDRVTQCNRCLAKEKKRAQGTKIRTCSKKIQLVEIQLYRDPTNEEVRDILSDSQNKLAEVFQDSV
jgi:hypothetical protein